MTDLAEPHLPGDEDAASHHAPLGDPDRVQLSPVLEVSKRPSPFTRVRHLWQYRELLVNLTRKELKVKYKNSFLGFVWSLLNPLLYLVVFSLVFQEVLQVKVPYYGILFLAGLLAWNFFNAGLMGGTSSIVGNAQLVTKVWFPRETLVLASVGAAGVHFLLQSLVLIGGMAVFRLTPSLTFLPALLLAIVLLLVFTSALAIALSAVNVYLRDTEHLLEVVLLAWFWLSCIAYPYLQLSARLVKRFGTHGEWVIMLNPVLVVIITFQRALYNPHHFGTEGKDALPYHSLAWYCGTIGVCLAVSLVLMYFALALFSRLEDNFAEEI